MGAMRVLVSCRLVPCTFGLVMLMSSCAGASQTRIGDPQFAAFKEEASERQKPFFNDGVIEYAEYEEAVFATVSCLEERGYPADAELAEDGFYQYVVQLESPDGRERMDESIEACRQEWSQQVELAFQTALGPSEDEMPAVLATLECLRDANVRHTTGTSPHQLRELIERLPSDAPARACADLLP